MGSKTRLTLVTQNSSFEDPLTVHPWDKLKDSLIGELTGDDINRLLTLSESKLGAHYEKLLNEESTSKCNKFFHCLEDSLGEDGTVRYLQNLMGDLNFHGDSGNVNYQELFLLYEEEKRDYISKCSQLGLEIDPTFVGRQNFIEQLLQILHREDQYKGLVLCGLPGMGKTSLASQICYRLMHNHHCNWHITVCLQREKDNFGQLMNDLLDGLSKELSFESEIHFEELTDRDKRSILINMIVEMSRKTSKHLILLDDMDDQFNRNPFELHELLSSIFYEISNSKNVKFLITVGSTICPVGELLKFGGKALLNNTMLEFEIPGLDLADATKLLSAISHKELDGSFCETISKEFNGNPMALKVAGVALRDFTDCSMYAYQSILTQTVNSVSGLLQKCFDMLQPEKIKFSLLRLSVFRTNWFDVQAAVHVTEGTARPLQAQFDTKHKTKAIENECITKLKCLKNKHLIEADKLQSFTGKRNIKENQLYSLHSIVLRFLYDTCEKTEAMQKELEIAKENFIWYFCKKIEHYGKENYSSPVAAKNALEMNKPHVELFFKLVGERGTRLEDYLSTKKTKASTSSRCEYVMSIAEFACVPQKRMYFAKKQSQIVKDNKQLFQYIYWKSKEAECLLACDRTELAFKEMSGVFNDFRVRVDIEPSGKVCPSFTAEGWHIHHTDEVFSLTRLYEVFGQALFHIGRKEKNKPKLNIALKNLEIAQAICDNIQHLDKIKKHDRAKIQNVIGCVHFELGDVNKALTFHGYALRIVAQDAQFTKDRCHTAIVEYQANIAACEHQLGLNTKNENNRKTRFGKAMEMYNKCIDINKRMGRDNLPPQVVLLRNRAEIFYIEKEYEKAIADGEKVKKRCLSLYVPPHTELTMAFERLANYKFKLGKRLIEVEGEQEKGKEYLYESLEMYNAVLSEICKGGMPSIEQSDDESIFRELAELITHGLPPVRSGLANSEYKEAMNAIKAGNDTRINDHNETVFRDIAQWLRDRRLDQPSNKTYRHTKANHIKVMKKLRQKDSEIRKTKQKYEKFELGKFNKLISENRRYVPDYDAQEKVRQALRAGASFIPDADQDLDSSTSESEDDSESDSNDTSRTSSTSDGSDEVDIQSEMRFSRQRKDSGMEEDMFIDDEKNEKQSGQQEESMMVEALIHDTKQKKPQNVLGDSEIFKSDTCSSTFEETKVLVRQFGIDEEVRETFHTGMVKKEDGNVLRTRRNSQSNQSRSSQSSDTSSGCFSLKRKSSSTESRRQSWRTGSSYGSQAGSIDDPDVDEEEDLLSHSQRMAFILEGPQERLSLSISDLEVTDIGEEVNEPQPKVPKTENGKDGGNTKLEEG